VEGLTAREAEIMLAENARKEEEMIKTKEAKEFKL
jgi:hypothetical protein